MNRSNAGSSSGAAGIWLRYQAFFLAGIAAILMSIVLFSGGGIGLSNNGDFGRVMGSNSLEFAQEPELFVYEDTYRMKLQGDSPGEQLWNLLFSTEKIEAYPSIHMVFVRASLVGNLAVNLVTGQSMDTYHIQVLGVIYLLCYAGLLLLLFSSFRLPNLGCDLLVKVAIIFILCDEGYVAYFNSLYSEPVQMLGLLAMVVFALRIFVKRGRAGWNIGWYFLSCVVYGWSKFINIPVAALCAVGMGAVLLLRMEKKYRLRLCAGAGACVVILGAVYVSLPGWMDYETNYNSVFYGVLKDTEPDEARQYVSDLGLPEYMAEYADTTYYIPRAASARGSAQFQQDFSKLSKVDLLFFYLSHPGYFLKRLDVAMAHAGFIRPYYLSNLDESSPRLSFAHRFDGWSRLRTQLPVNTWGAAGAITAMSCLVLWRTTAVGTGGRKDKLSRGLLLLTVVGAMTYQFIMPIISNGEGDLAKHMFAYVQLVDLLVVLILVWVGYRLSVWKKLHCPAVALAGGTAAVCFLLLLPAGLLFLRTRLPWNSLETGAYVQMGSWEGEPLLWQVAQQQEDGSWLILAADAVDTRAFDEDSGYGSNLWSDSDLRTWLNGTFFTGAFTREEQALLQPVEHRVLLSGVQKDKADSGYNDFFAFHVPKYSDRGMDDALAMSCTDAVRLPDIGLLAELSRQGLCYGPPCWMETPYYNNDSMVRVMGSDGYFYMRDASDTWGVRPVIRLPADVSYRGSGTPADPFQIEYDAMSQTH